MMSTHQIAAFGLQTYALVSHRLNRHVYMRAAEWGRRYWVKGSVIRAIDPAVVHVRTAG